MRVLVTGATGFLGRRVVPALMERRHEVACLVHRPGRERIFPPRTVDVHYGNVMEPDTLPAAFEDADAVVHLVGIIRRRRRSAFDLVNRQGAANVAAAAKESGVKHVTLVSALGAAEDRAYPYLHSKWEGERALVNSGVPYTIIRPSIVFGEGDEFLNSIAALVKAMPITPIIGSGRNRLQPISADDLARCVATSVEREDLKGRTLELGGPEQLSYDEIVSIVTQAMGVRRPRVHVPALIMNVLVSVMELFLPRPPITTDQLRMMAIRNVAESDGVEKAFGFTPMGLERNIDYVKSVGLGMGCLYLPGRCRGGFGTTEGGVVSAQGPRCWWTGALDSGSGAGMTGWGLGLVAVLHGGCPCALRFPPSRASGQAQDERTASLGTGGAVGGAGQRAGCWREGYDVGGQALWIPARGPE